MNLLKELQTYMSIAKQCFSVMSAANRSTHRLLKRCGAVLIGLSMHMFNFNLQEKDAKQ